MSGRLQSEQKLKKQIEERINKYNNQVQEYFYNLLQSKTAATVSTYMINVFLFMDFLEEQRKSTDIHKINEASLNKYFNSIKTIEKNGKIVEASYSRISLAWNSLNSYFKYFVRKKVIKHNPMDCIEPPKKTTKEQKKVLTVEELKLIQICIYDEEDFIAYRDLTIFFILKDTGMRVGALCNIDIDDISIDDRKIRVIDKGRKYHEYPMTQNVYDMLTEYLLLREQHINELKDEGRSDIDESALFLTKKGNRIYRDYISKMIHKYAIRALGEEEGKKVTPHSFRRALCTLLYDKTNDIYFVQQVIGHKNISTTELYIKDDTEAKRDKSVEILDDIF